MDSSFGGFRPRPVNLRSPPTNIIPSRSVEEVEDVLERLQCDTGYSLERELGLRRLLAPVNLNPDGGQPANHQRGREIFIGRLPKDLLEDELFAFCSGEGLEGTIQEIRLMLQEDGLSNRGYAFVVFSSFQFAQDAISKLDNMEIRPGCRVGVKRSVDNCRLFMGNIPRDRNKEEFENEIRKHPSCGANILQAFVEFPSHRDAAIVRRQLMKDKLTMWGKEICVDWAQPEAEVDKSIMDQVRVLYVRNLSHETTEERLLGVFAGFVEEASIEKVKKLRDFAFVHFQTRTDAERALELLNGTLVDGSTIEVMWAKPNDSRNLPHFSSRTPHNVFPWNTGNMFPNFFSYGHPDYNVPMNYRNTFNINAMNSYRGQPALRHYRNAAGTRTRYGRFNGSFPYEILNGTGNFSHTHGYYINGSHDGYSSSGYVTPEQLANYQPMYPQALNLHSIPSPIHSQSPIPGSYSQLRNSHEILAPLIYPQSVPHVILNNYGHHSETQTQTDHVENPTSSSQVPSQSE